MPSLSRYFIGYAHWINAVHSQNKIKIYSVVPFAELIRNQLLMELTWQLIVFGDIYSDLTTFQVSLVSALCLKAICSQNKNGRWPPTDDRMTRRLPLSMEQEYHNFSTKNFVYDTIIFSGISKDLPNAWPKLLSCSICRPDQASTFTGAGAIVDSFRGNFVRSHHLPGSP